MVALEALALAQARLGKPYADLGRIDDLHVLVEALRAALADRDAVVADPDVTGNAAAKLLGAGYLAARAATLDSARARPVWAAGVGRAASTAASRDGDTVNLVAIDESGLAVSLTQSLFADFGSGVPVSDFGFMLQNRGACFSFDGEARNAIAPGRRPLHTLMPGMAVAADRVRHVFGCMGGHGQAQTQAQLLSRIAAGDDPQEAIGAPRFVVDPEATEPAVSVESRLPVSLREGLAAYGFTVETLGEWEDIMGTPSSSRSSRRARSSAAVTRGQTGTSRPGSGDCCPSVYVYLAIEASCTSGDAGRERAPCEPRLDARAGRITRSRDITRPRIPTVARSSRAPRRAERPTAIRPTRRSVGAATRRAAQDRRDAGALRDRGVRPGVQPDCFGLPAEDIVGSGRIRG